MDLSELIGRFAGSGVVATAAYDSAGDLTVQFENGNLLQVFNDSCGYEGWILHGPGQRTVVAQGGGRVVEIAPNG